MNQSIRTRRAVHPLVGCLLFLLICPLVMVSVVVAVALFSPSLLTGVGLQVVGFRPQGNTAEAFVGYSESVPTLAPLQGAIIAQSNTLNADAFGSQPLNHPAVKVEVGTTENGQAGAVITINETDLPALCQQYTPACSAEGLTLNGFIIRNGQFDLRLSGVIARFEVASEVSGLAQPLGVVLRVNPTSQRFEALGLDVNGQLFGTPNNELGEFIHSIESQLNQIVDSATLSTDGGSYSVHQIDLSDGLMRISLR